MIPVKEPKEFDFFQNRFIHALRGRRNDLNNFVIWQLHHGVNEALIGVFYGRINAEIQTR